MKEQIESDVKRILKEKYDIKHYIKVDDVVSVGLNRTCSVTIGEGWTFEHITYEELDERACFVYNPELIADMMVPKIKRYNLTKKKKLKKKKGSFF